ncbi:MAG: hypothetical protein V4510_05640 [bacterium]
MRVGLPLAIGLAIGLLLASGVLVWNWSSGRIGGEATASLDLFGELHFKPGDTNETKGYALDDSKTYTLEFDSVADKTASPLGAVSGLAPSNGQLDVSRATLNDHGVHVANGNTYRFRVFQDGVATAQPPSPPGGGYEVAAGMVLPGGFWLWTLSLGFGPAVILVGISGLISVIGSRSGKTSRAPDRNPAARPPSVHSRPVARTVAAEPTRTAARGSLPTYPIPAAPVARRASTHEFSIQVVDSGDGRAISGASVEHAAGEVPFSHATKGKDGVLHFTAPLAGRAVVSAPGYRPTEVRLQADGVQRIALTADRVSIAVRVVGERTGAALQGIPVFLQRGEQIVAQQKSDLEGRVRFDVETTVDGCLVGTAVEREGFEDTVADAASGGNGTIQLSVGFRFQPTGPDVDALVALRQDSERLVRQCASFDPEMGALVNQAAAPFLTGLQGLPEWGGLLLSSPYAPVAVHRALVREGHNLIASLQATLSEKAIINKLTSSRRNLASAPRLEISSDAAQILLRASSDQLIQERQRVGATIQRLDEAITKLAAGHDVLLPSTLWQALSQAFQERQRTGADLVAQVLFLQVQAALVSTVVQDPAWRARMTS